MTLPLEYIPNGRDRDRDRATKRLQKAYDDYVSHVSPAFMAISLETAAYILWAAEKFGVTSAVDFGSGFTSYILRLACDDVISVDDSPEWLAWTGRFLERHNQTSGELVTWDDYYREHFDRKNDLVVYDFSSGQMRDDHFMFAVGQIAAGGLGVMDDAQHEKHQESMHKAAAAYRYNLYGLQDWTRDWQRRFAALVVA